MLKLIANGKDNAQIAAELHISPKTVKNHISNILMKLQIDNRIQAAVYAVEVGIVVALTAAARTSSAALAERAEQPAELREVGVGRREPVRERRELARCRRGCGPRPTSAATSAIRRSSRQRSASSASASA